MSRPGWPTLVALLLFAVSALIRAQAPPLTDLLERMAAYASAFQQDRASLVAEERYVQDVTYRNLPPNRFAGVTHRELRSDVLLVRPQGSEQYIEFRDVFEVDGRAVRDRQDRLTKLFLEPSASADVQLRQINRESARYNIGNVERTTNTSMLPLQFLLPQQRPRFRFSLGRGGTGGEVAVEFEEVQRPTLIRTPAGLDLPAHGRFWTERATGRIVMTELVTEDTSVRAAIQVRYAWDERAERMMPAEMRERYDVFRDGAVIVGTAAYGNIRRFEVTSNERLGPADPAKTDAPTLVEQPETREQTLPMPLTEREAAAPTAPAQPPSTPRFKSGAEVVLVDFVVTDRSGRAVSGLTAKDVLVKEDGKERPIVSFEAFAPNGSTDGATSSSLAVRSPGAATVILVDDVHLTPAQGARLRPALRGLLATVGTRNGALMLVAPGSKVSAVSESAATEAASMVEQIAGSRVDEHTNFPVADAEALAIARRDNPVIARVAARFITSNPELSSDQAETIAIERGVDLAHQARVRRDAMYDVMLQCLDWLASRAGRHRLILVSGGFVTDSDDARYFDVVTRSLRANAPIDVLDARGLAGFDRYHDVEFGPALGRHSDEGPFGRFEAGEGPMGLAVDTGGVIVSNTNDMRRGLDELLDSMATYYIVGYQPPSHTKTAYHKIKVEVRGKGLHIRARTGYQTP